MNKVLSVALTAILLSGLAGCTKTYDPKTPNAEIPPGEARNVEQQQKQSNSVTDPGSGSSTGDSAPR